MQDKTKRIIYYLNNLETEELAGRPYRIFEDMAIMFGYLKEDGREIEQIDYESAKKNGWDDDFLWKIARKNTKILLPAKIEPIYKNLIAHTQDEPVFFLSNKIQRYGAGVILYNDLLQDFATKYGENLYLLPTSIHEFLVLLDQGIYSEEELLKILKKSNKDLNKGEFLSENIYYYERKNKELINLF